MDEMILVTGSGGKTGRAVIAALRKRGVKIRALVRRGGRMRSLQGCGREEIVAGDMRSPEAMEWVVNGASAVYHIPPNVSPDETAIGETVIRAARSAGVKRFVYHSVIHPQIEAMPHHWNKMRVEEMLFESGLDYTILQPAPYMQNILPYLAPIRDERKYRLPYSGEARLNAVDLEDIAEAAAAVLCEPGHSQAVYELCGPDNLTSLEECEILSRLLGFQVEFEFVPLEKWETEARSKGLGGYQVEALVKMFRYYEEFGLSGNPRVLEGLLGRPPGDFYAFLERTLRESTS
ncbi:MAG: NmrA family NAD(P)-binding protein [Anaerolineales bacterium]